MRRPALTRRISRSEGPRAANASSSARIASSTVLIGTPGTGIASMRKMSSSTRPITEALTESTRRLSY
ncbi:MAG: hypothetical protein A2V88_05735 [Elusimicrobia bacterium RBG_16_66_12]|nr:MAG: hypothetical protein A2V88_05735 [Elusimicrobia bacterium RBG_16_66_12]